MKRYEKSAEKRERFFRLQAAATQRAFLNAPPGLCACPLCLLAFPIETIHNGVLRLEHVPAKSLGGKPICLTCAKCNSEIGSSLDIELRKFENVREFLSRSVPTGKRRAVKVKLADAWANALTYRTDGTVFITDWAKMNPPGIAEQFTRRLQQGGELSMSVDFHQDRPKQGYPEIAVLRIAFLAAFALWGYRYAFSEWLLPVRRQILKPATKTLDGFYAAAPPSSETENSIQLVTSPSWCASVMVQFKCHRAFLPIQSNPQLYDKICEARTREVTQFVLRGTSFRWPAGPVLLLDMKADGSLADS